MFNTTPEVGQEVLNIPFGEMIYKMSFAIAEAQLKLDENSIEVAEMMGGLKAVTYELNGEEHLNFEDSRIFFGKQKLTLTNAVETHNATTDQAQRQSIVNAAGDNVEYEAFVFSAEPTVLGDFYKGVDPGNNVYAYYIDTGGSSPVTTWYQFIEKDVADYKFKKLSGRPKNVKVKLTSTASGTDVVYAADRVSMMELGFTPTFYQFVDTLLDVKVSISFTSEGSRSRESTSNSRNRSGSFSFGFRRGVRANRSISTSQVNASYSQKYSYSAEASSSLRTKLVPIPSPPILEERIGLLMELAREEGTAE